MRVMGRQREGRGDGGFTLLLESGGGPNTKCLSSHGSQPALGLPRCAFRRLQGCTLQRVICFHTLTMTHMPPWEASSSAPPADSGSKDLRLLCPLGLGHVRCCTNHSAHLLTHPHDLGGCCSPSPYSSLLFLLPPASVLPPSPPTRI